MGTTHRLPLATVAALLTSAAAARSAAAQTAPPAPPSPPAVPYGGGPAPTLPTMPATPADPSADPSAAAATAAPDAGTTATAGDAGSTPPREPQAGDFDAGGKVRLPSGPDEMGQFATFNWIAVDLKGRYYLTRTITLDGNAPLAVKKPDQLMTGEDPRMIGGMSVTLDARLPKMPFQPTTYQTDVDLVLTGAYAREGALLLGEKDFPLFTGGFQPGFTAGAQVKIKLSSLIDFATAPVFVYQSGATDALTAVQIPTSTIIGLGSVLKVSADLDVMTGDDYSFSGAAGGRIAAGGSITLKVGPIMAHAGAGVASLLTGGMYPTIGDSVYVDLDVKYVK